MLLRFDPFQEMDRLVGALDRFGAPASMRSRVPIDAYRQGEELVVHADLPGVDPASVEVTVERNVLTIAARRVPEPARADEQTRMFAAERFHGELNRQVLLGEGLDTGKISAVFHDGVLTLTIPLAAAVKPHKVAIATAAPADRTITAQSS
jgi:HSP20 family protein